MNDGLSIIVPVYNERPTIESLVMRCAALDLPVAKEIVIVDDGSTDGTRDFLSDHLVKVDGVRIVLHGSNAGKGSAVRTGARFATGRWLVIQDADLEYDPEEIPALLEVVLSGRGDVAYGSRFLGQPRWAKWSQRVANRVLTWITNRLYGARITDMETCYKLMSREVFLGLDLRAEGFEVEPEVTAKLLRSGLVVTEVPISYAARTRADGKKIGWRDGVTALRTLWKLRRWSPPRRVEATELFADPPEAVQQQRD
jgi:glycosyltransferase involved in cell wall biosynthesis